MSSLDKKYFFILTFVIIAAAFVMAACSTQSGPWPMPSGYTYHHQKHKAPPGPDYMPEDSAPADPSVQVFTVAEPEPAPPPMTETDVAMVPMIPPADPADMPMPPDDMTSARAESAAMPLLPPQAEERTEEKMPPAEMAEYESESRPAPAPAPVPAPAAATYTWQSAADDLLGQLLAGAPPPSAVRLESIDGEAPDAQANFGVALRQEFEKRNIRIAGTDDAAGPAIYYAARPLIAEDPSRLFMSLTLMNGRNIGSEASGVYTITGSAPASREGMRMEEHAITPGDPLMLRPAK